MLCRHLSDDFNFFVFVSDFCKYATQTPRTLHSDSFPPTLQDERHGGISGLECRDCHRSFSNRRQILKHICLKEEVEEEDEEENGELLYAKEAFKAGVTLLNTYWCWDIIKYLCVKLQMLGKITEEYTLIDLYLLYLAIQVILINRLNHFQGASVVEQEPRVLGVWILGEQIQTRRNKTQQDQDS